MLEGKFIEVHKLLNATVIIAADGLRRSHVHVSNLIQNQFGENFFRSIPIVNCPLIGRKKDIASTAVPLPSFAMLEVAEDILLNFIDWVLSSKARVSVIHVSIKMS